MVPEVMAAFMGPCQPWKFVPKGQQLAVWNVFDFVGQLCTSSNGYSALDDYDHATTVRFQ
jgi:hypothetical protein